MSKERKARIEKTGIIGVDDKEYDLRNKIGFSKYCLTEWRATIASCSVITSSIYATKINHFL